jgi:endonuclease I
MYKSRILLSILSLFHFYEYGISYEFNTSNAQIILSATELYDFREVYTGMASDVQFYEISAQGLTNDLAITTLAPFRISLHCYDNFDNSITLQPISGTVSPTRIYVRFFPEHTGKINNLISHNSSNTTIQTVKVSGSGIENPIPSDYYSTATDSGSQLKTQLHKILNNHQTQTYASLLAHFKSTDVTFSGHVWDMYSDIPCEPPPYIYTFDDDQDQGFGGSREGEFYNREHSMPRSWFGGAIDPMNTDLYHIFPVDKRVNAIRDNYPFGEVSNPSITTQNGGKLGTNTRFGYSGITFEPIDAYKGDLARTFFYMITRYEDQIENWTFSQEGMAMLDNARYPGYESWALKMLLEWHELDPVSQKEINRNNAVYQIQGNRNPFVDHPEFVQKIWADTITNISNINAQTTFSLFPNPASDHLIIKGPDANVSVTFMSIQGKFIRFNYQTTTGNKVELPELPAGPYIIRITSGFETHHQMIIIKR